MAGLTLNQAERRELIAALVTNCAGWDDEDIGLLANMSSDKLWAHAQGCAQLIANEDIDDSGLPDTLEPSSASELETAAEDSDEEQVVDDGDQGDNLAETEQDEDKDQPKKCHDEEGNEIECGDSETAEGENVTENQYLRRLPPRIQSVVMNALRFEQEQKRQLVGRITTNRRNRFSEGYLMRMGLDELQALAEIASPVRNSPTYAAAAGGPTFNESQVDRDDILTIPVLEFTKN
jgi:hypothetical protein